MSPSETSCNVGVDGDDGNDVRIHFRPTFIVVIFSASCVVQSLTQSFPLGALSGCVAFNSYFLRFGYDFIRIKCANGQRLLRPGQE